MIKLDLEKNSLKLLALFLLADLFFLVLHLLHIRGWGGVLASPLFLLGTDRGHAEFYQYLKIFWCVVLLVYLARRRRRLIYLSWAALFTYFLLDDSLELHEILGARVAEMLLLHPVLGLRPQDLGELAVSLFFGVLLISLIALTYLHAGEAGRHFSQRMFALLAALVFFGVFLDMLDIIIFGPTMSSPLETLENWGEMLVISAMTWYVYAFSSPSPPEIPPLE